MRLKLSPTSLADYEIFLKVKGMPRYRFTGREVWVPDEYAEKLGVQIEPTRMRQYVPKRFLFDYQRDIAGLAIRRRKFAVFMECGLGKTFIALEYARHVLGEISANQCALIVCPLMVVDQTISEAAKFYGDELPIERIYARDLESWLTSGTSRLGITNYEALKRGLPQGRLGALIPDESSIMKSAYGQWGRTLIRLGKGLHWKLALTGTPAPNDRIEYANHAIFLDAFPTVNSFLAKFFVNRGQTDNRWEMKPHALRSFYTALSHWSIFVSNPAVYGWKDNAGSIPPIHVHIHDVLLTPEQQAVLREETGQFYVSEAGGITKRSVLSQISKGSYRGRTIPTNKPEYIRSLVDSWPAESTIIWCKYDEEQAQLTKIFPNAANINGKTPHKKRVDLIGDFQTGRRNVLITKPKILGFGLNLQVATRHVFSGLEDSYEAFHQAIKRSNRVGSDLPLNVHIPVTDAERPMIDTVLRKAHRVDQDNREQEAMFRDAVA